MRIMIDCYGHPSNSERYQNAKFEKRAHIVDKPDENMQYICFDNTAKRAIHRIAFSGTQTEITWAFGAWDNRSTLDYSNTLNDPILVEESDIG